jgi:hypothetical protein
MTSTSQLGDMFFAGRTSGTSNRSQIVNGKNFTYLVDYGWAVLAMRNKKTGKVTYFSGWDKYSTTTSKHISQFGLRHRAHKTVNKKRQLSEGVR